MPKKTDPVEQDSDDDVVEILFKGVTFTVERDRGGWSTECTLAVYEAIATGLNHHWVRYVRLALGEEQWARLLDVATERRDLLAFINEFTTTTNNECVD